MHQGARHQEPCVPTEINEPFLKFSNCHISPYLQEYAEKNLNETEEKRSTCIQEMKQILKEDKDIDVMDEESILLMFLRSRKFDVHRAVEFIKTSIKTIDAQRHVLERDDPLFLHRVLRANIAGYLAYRDAKQRAIIYIRIEAWDPGKISAKDCFLGMMVAFQAAIYNPINQVVGYVVILNLTNLTVRQAVLMTRWLLFAIIVLQKMNPCFLKTVHVIHNSIIFRAGWNIVQSAIKAKIRKRIIFHAESDLSALYEHLPRSILPVELGGAFPFTNEHWACDIDEIFSRYCQRLKSNSFKTRKQK